MNSGAIPPGGGGGATICGGYHWSLAAAGPPPCKGADINGSAGAPSPFPAFESAGRGRPLAPLRFFYMTKFSGC